MTRYVYVLIPEIDNEIAFRSPPEIFHSRFPFREDLAWDMLNVFLKVAPDPNVVELYKIFCKPRDSWAKRMIAKIKHVEHESEPDLERVQKLVNILMERYNQA